MMRSLLIELNSSNTANELYQVDSKKSAQSTQNITRSATIMFVSFLCGLVNNRVSLKGGTFEHINPTVCYNHYNASAIMFRST